jgi:beta-lactamase regulating signal transducer with metallopeptidase domain
VSPWHDLADLASPALGWTLVHSVWQTGLLALAYAAWRAVARRAPVCLRYRVAFLALVLGVAGAGATFWSLGSADQSDQVVSHVSTGTTTVAMIGQALPAPLRAALPVALPSAPNLPTVLSGLVVLWTAGVLVLTIRFLGGVFVASQIRRRAVPIERGHLVTSLCRLTVQLGIDEPVQLLESDEVETPVAMGWRRPAVLLPSALVHAEAGASFEPLLAHELAHVRSRDYAVNLVQSGLDTLLFFCPGARFLSAEVRRLREYRCDDLAVALCDRPATYLRALAGLVEVPSPSFPAPAASGPSLVDRMKRLSEGDGMSRFRATHTLALAAALVLTALLGSSLLSASRLHAARRVKPTAAALAWTCTAAMPLLKLTLTDPFARNELVPHPGPGRQFHCNPLHVDGRPADAQTVTVETHGTLTLVHVDPHSGVTARILFTVSLRGDGKVLDEPKSALLNRPLLEADLGSVFAFARSGDQLIVDPVNPGDWRAKRIIALGGC